MMRSLGRHVSAALGALLLLATVQVLVETVAFLWVWRGQVMPPYGFFPNQLYDFLAKLRYFGAGFLGWAPALPDSFLAPETAAHLAILTDLFLVDTVMAVLLATLVGMAGALLRGRWQAKARGYLAFWALLALCVHLVAALPAFSLSESPTFNHLVYRTHSLIVDGTAVSFVVLLVSVGIARAAQSLLRRPAATGAAIAVVVLALVVAVLHSAPQNPPAATVAAGGPVRSPYNVLLISLDSLRADHVGCYGYGRATSPALDRLASEGIRFANATATSSWTLPTHLSVFTSRYQLSHGVVDDTLTLSPAVPILGEVMKSNGYVTAGFVSAPYVAAVYGYARGMDVYEDISATYKHRSEANSVIVAPEITARASRWLKQHRDDRFFLFLHYFDIHYDYIPRPPYDKMFDPDYEGSIDGRNYTQRADVRRGMSPRDLAHIVALYDGEIRFTDRYVGEILDRINELGLRENTLVILLADHGDEFFEHGNKGHHRTVYDEVLEVPLLMRLPDGSHAGEVVDEQVSLVDVMPTILDFLGIEGPTGMEGLSVMPLVEGSGGLDRDAVYAEFFDKKGFNLQVARRTPYTKTIQHFNRITHPRRSPLEFYDLREDPGERRNLAQQRSEEVRRQLDLLAGWIEKRWRVNRSVEEQTRASNRIEIDAETLERLKSLGYAGQ